MNLDRRTIHHGMYLTEVEIAQFHNYCKVIAGKIMDMREVVQVWYNKSLSSEAVYFHVKLHCGEIIQFSIRNHNSKAAKRQKNFYLADYARLLDLRLIVTEWIKEQVGE